MIWLAGDGGKMEDRKCSHNVVMRQHHGEDRSH